MGQLDFQEELEHTRNYSVEVEKLAKKGAKLIVLPERAINVNAKNDSETIAILGDVAKNNHVTIVTGYTNYKNKTAHNSALVIGESGKVIMDYNKSHLVSILEDEFVSGKKPGLFPFQHYLLGTAICKDLDFPDFTSQYGKNKITFLCIPAWDFKVDNWLHSRMSILSGVENGFSEVRTARLGRLLISDPYGRINAEADCADGKENSLIGQVSLNRKDTSYTQLGDWFGWLIVISAITFLLQMIIKTRIKSANISPHYK
jgi:apolipoprotein N-acyltransferase